MEECRLELHPKKTKIVYCKDDDRRRRYPNEKFDFLGYGFQPRRSKNRFGKYFINFSPAISDQAGKSIREEIRSWDLHLRSDKSIEDQSRMFNPKIRGWLQYYGRYYRSALISVHASTGPLAGPLGVSKIQKAARSFTAGDTLDCGHFASWFEGVCSLAGGGGGG